MTASPSAAVEPQADTSARDLGALCLQRAEIVSRVGLEGLRKLQRERLTPEQARETEFRCSIWSAGFVAGSQDTMNAVRSKLAALEYRDK